MGASYDDVLIGVDCILSAELISYERYHCSDNGNEPSDYVSNVGG